MSGSTDLLVGIKLLILPAREDSALCMLCLIDNQAIQNYRFDAKMVVWKKKKSDGPISFGGRELKNPKAVFPVKNFSQIDWTGAKVIYFGPDDPRIVRTENSWIGPDNPYSSAPAPARPELPSAKVNTADIDAKKHQNEDMNFLPSHLVQDSTMLKMGKLSSEGLTSNANEDKFIRTMTGTKEKIWFLKSSE
jgi:hypothetical protein